MMLKSSLLLFVLASIALSQQTKAEFEIRKRHPKWTNSVPLGKLTISIFQQHHNMQAEVEPYHSEFLTESDFQEGSPIILQFIPLKSTSEQYKDKVFTTSVDELNSDPHGQKIVIVTGFDPTHLSINAINYVQTRTRVGEIYTEVLYPKEEESNIFKYVPVAKKNEQEEESFFSRYKWPLIIGGVLLFTMMSSNPDQGQQGTAPRA